MKLIIGLSAILLAFSTFASAQKGIDTQTQQIKQEGNKTTQQSGNTTTNPANRSFDWGKDKTKTREMLPNPYRMNSRRNVLVENILEVLKDKKLVVNESASRLTDGFIVTEPYVFAKGPVIARNELSRYAILPNSDTAWTRGRYTMTIEVVSIDGIQNNIYVTTKIEGRSENGLQPEWTTLQSSGAAEDAFLVKLIEMVTGTSPDAQPDIDQQ